MYDIINNDNHIKEVTPELKSWVKYNRTKLHKMRYHLFLSSLHLVFYLRQFHDLPSLLIHVYRDILSYLVWILFPAFFPFSSKVEGEGGSANQRRKVTRYSAVFFAVCGGMLRRVCRLKVSDRSANVAEQTHKAN